MISRADPFRLIEILNRSHVNVLVTWFCDYSTGIRMYVIDDVAASLIASVAREFP